MTMLHEYLMIVINFLDPLANAIVALKDSPAGMRTCYAMIGLYILALL